MDLKRYAFAFALVSACDSPKPSPAVAEKPAAPAPEKKAEPPTVVAPQAPEPSVPPRPSARPAPWGYGGGEGPEHWSSLSPAYAACAEKEGQSPIDLASKTGESADGWSLTYGTSSLRITHHEHVHDLVDNGHTIQVTVDAGSTLKTKKDTYELLQFHFHTPSENTVDGKHYPMEAHFVHQAKDGKFGVVAMFFEEGEENPELAKLIPHFPAEKGQTTHLPDQQLDLRLHLPKTMDAFVFTGSFTTPPCTEDVEWVVLKQPVQASGSQVEAFAQRLGHNNRPVQPLASRSIVIGRLGESP